MDLPWCNLEAQSCVSSSSLTALLTSSIPFNLSGFINNQVARSTLKIRYQFRQHFKFKSESFLAPLLRNHLFRPALTDSTFFAWHNKGLKCFNDIYKDVFFFCSFPDLSGEFHLPPSHLFRYFQIRHCAKALFPVFPSSPPSLQWEELLSHDPLHKSLISKVYNAILSSDSSPVTKIKAAWERELGLSLRDDWWDTALRKIYTSSVCTRLTLIQFKVLFRVNFFTFLLPQIYPNITDNCDKCHASSST